MTLMHAPVIDLAPYRSRDRVAIRPQRVDDDRPGRRAATALDLREDFFDDKIDRHISRLRN
jgi:hypothetical protein